ncbi:MAG: hypothetical protein LW853_03515 [Rickettsiales bacterium]|jgi:hypothetical protein|nr:hypothetical protein [Rickettsiales bacterium]
MTQMQQSAAERIKTLLTSKGFKGDIEGLIAAVQADEKLSKLKPEVLLSAILSTLNAVRENPNGTKQLHISELPLAKIREFAGNISSGVYELPLNQNRIKMLHDRVAQGAANDAAMYSRQSNGHGIANQGEHWHHINKALGWVGAGMMTLGALSSAGAVVSKDDQDRTKINVTPLLWTLLQGTMAAGILYLTVRQPQMVQTALR